PLEATAPALASITSDERKCLFGATGAKLEMMLNQTARNVAERSALAAGTTNELHSSPRKIQGTPLPIRELQLDAPVAGGVHGRQRLVLAVARGDQALVGNALAVQELHHGNGARGGQFPVRRI